MKLVKAAVLGLALTGTAAAQDAPSLGLELNRSDPVESACRLTFVLSNGLEQDVDGLVAETVLFSKDGGVMLLTLFDFGALPKGRPRVRQFQVADTACDMIGQVLINGVSSCTIAGADSGLCARRLRLSSRVDIALEG